VHKLERLSILRASLWCIALAAALALNGCGGGGGNGGGTPPPPLNVTVSVSPTFSGVAATTQTQTFAATVTGSTDSGVTWSVDNVDGGNSTVGTISASGVYTPPPTGGSHTITATSEANTAVSGTATIGVTDLPGVFTQHNDLARDGANTQEYALTADSVNTTRFGKLFACAVDGAVYTQPLWVPGLTIGDGNKHNVIFVATQQDSLYAFDADANPCVTYWHVSLIDTLHGGTSGEVPVPWEINGSYQVGVGAGDIRPEIGVTGTPVIDPATNTIYVVSKSEITSSTTFFQRVHALDLATGKTEKFNGPVGIAASVPGVGDGGTTVSFSTQMENQRSALALANGTVYVTYAAHEDAQPYHGWVLGYNAANLSQAPSVFNTTPNGGLGGIWSGGGAPAIDAGGDVYVATGNGVFDQGSGMPMSDDFGDSILRLHPFTGSTANGTNLNLAGWFTPDDQSTLAQFDTDLGSGGVVLLPDQTGAVEHLLFEVGKEGVVYLIDRDNMGFFNPSNNSQIVESFNGPANGVWGTPAFWNNSAYLGGQSDTLKQFTFDPSSELFSTSATSATAHVFGYPGDVPSVSSQGDSNGIVWAIDVSQYGPPAPGPGPAVVHAYSATNLQTEYWNSSMSGTRDQAGNAVKFVAPTIANGKVYISTRTEVDVYGLLPN
jgi:hypothetical protein